MFHLKPFLFFSSKKNEINLKDKYIFSTVKKNQTFYIEKVNSYLSELNISNANYFWWAFNLSSKNPLSSSFVYKMTDILASLDLDRNETFKNTDYSGFSIAQQKILNECIGSNEGFYQKTTFFLSQSFKIIFDFVKATLRIFQILCFFLFRKINKNKHNILIFTFVDGSNRDEKDPYFGNLKNLISKEDSNKFVGYLYYLYRPFFKMAKTLKKEKPPHNYIFSYLKPQDYFWCFTQIIKAYFFKVKKVQFLYNNKPVSLEKLVRETMLSEISRGLIENLLLFCAFKRLNSNKFLEKIIYPFENKSLEKLLLLGLSSNIKTIGYQHSSITPRHLSFKLSKREIKITPLPDKIITLGKITHKWLVEKGNFPSQKVNPGVALRSFNNKYFNKTSFNPNKAKLLFVFSSSLNEIIKTIDLLKDISNTHSFIYKFKFHINFPMSSLEQEYQDWINKKVDFISSDSLYNEFRWADIMIYISSSAVLESLMCHLPVIRLDLDKLNSNPLLNFKPSLFKEVKSSKDFIKSVFEISYLSDDEKNDMALSSKKFAESYMVPQENFNSKMFF